MKKIILVILLAFLFVNCNLIDKKPNVTIIKKDKSSSEFTKNNDSLKNELRNLKTLELDFNNLYSIFENSDFSENVVDRKTDKWIFDLEKIDSLQFERADIIKPLTKLYENEEILSIIFTDLYDYKTSLHVFTFKKPELTPVSSFILYLFGGDGEDFWNIKCEQINPLTYKLKEDYGYDNNAIKKGEYLINFRQIRELTIDEKSGLLKKVIVKTEKDIIENR